MAVLRHCIIHSGYLLRSGESSLVDAHVVVFTLETVLVFDMVEHCPAFGLYEHSWGCSVPMHPALNSPRAPEKLIGTLVCWRIAVANPSIIWRHPRKVAGYELRRPEAIFKVKLKALYDGSTKTLHHS